MTDTNFVKFEAGRNDAAIAADLRARLDLAMQPVIAIMEEGKKAGLLINFAIGQDAFGRSVLMPVSISRPL